MQRYLEITLDTKERLGFYQEVTDAVDVEIIEWFKKPGDVIGSIEDPDTLTVEGEPIVKGESAKGVFILKAMGWEIGARIVEILISEGERITIDLRKESLKLALLEVKTDITEKPQPETTGTIKEEKPPQRITPLARELIEDLGVKIEAEEEKTIRLNDVLASPVVRRRARELGIDLTGVRGSGPEGIITERDLEKIVKERKVIELRPPVPEEGEVEVIRPSLRRLTIAKNMAKAWIAPQASAGIDIDASALIEYRERMKDAFEKLHGIKLRYDYLFAAACAWLLTQKEFRILNGRWVERDGKAFIELYRHVNIGIATAIPPSLTKSGFSELVTPVIKNADRLSFIELAKRANKLIDDAISGNPKPEDQMGATFTVNNTGSPVEWRGIHFSGDEFPGPIFPPDTGAILSFGAVREEVGRKRMRIALCFDHRLCDGFEVKLFLRALQWLIEHPEQITALV